MRSTTTMVVASLVLALGACSGEASAPAPTPRANTQPATPPTAPMSEPAPEPPPPPPPPPPAPEPDAAVADPLRARIQSDPNDAQARCELGWLYFEAGNLEVAETETTRGVSTLENDFRIADARKRQTLGACLYNRGRVMEARARARGEADPEATRRDLSSAFDFYKRSLWYRENATVRTQWTTIATELGRTGERPESVPASLWTYAAGRETEACGAAPEPGAETFGEDSTEGSCAVHVEAIASGRGGRKVAVLSIGDYDDAGTPDTAWDDRGETSYELLTFDGQAWVTRGPVYSTDIGVESSVGVEARFQDVQPGGEPEVLLTISDDWYTVSDDEGDGEDDSSGHHEELVVCGMPEGAVEMVCAHIVTREDRSDYDSERVASVAVRFLAEGRVTIRGRMDGERVREETTVAQLWANVIAERQRAAEAAARRAATPPPTPPPVEITGARTTAPSAPTPIPPSPAP